MMVYSSTNGETNPHQTKGKKMQVTVEQIQEITNNADTIFMKQGKGGKTVHVSAGACRQNNLLCGVTYSRNGRRQSYLFPLNLTTVNVDSMCKNCLANLDSMMKVGA